MKKLIFYILFILTNFLLLGCLSSTSKTILFDYSPALFTAQNQLFGSTDIKIDNSENETEALLNSLSLFQKLYYEVESGINKWVEVDEIITYEYNEKNQITSEKSFFDEIENVYDTKGNKIVEQHSNITFYYFYDENNYEISCMFSSGYSENYTNDKYGNHIYSIDSDNNERYFEYDNYNRLLTVNNKGKSIYKYTYCSDNPKIKTYTAKITNNINNQESFLYMEKGLETGYEIIENEIHLYKRRIKYNWRYDEIYRFDSIKGEYWYFYIYDNYGRKIKKVSLKSL